MMSRLRLAWAALRGQLRGGIYIAPIDQLHAEFHVESCLIEGRIGKGTPILQFSKDFPGGHARATLKANVVKHAFDHHA
jgi:hypothetical protein